MLGSTAAIPLTGKAAEHRSVFEPDPLQVALMDRFKIEVPVLSWPSGGGRCLRISAQAYNRREDYERLADALRVLRDEARGLT
jgi:isopenicillin-N epimerase